MDSPEFVIFRSDVKAQMALIDDVFTNLEDRAQDLDTDDTRQLESVAYQIHNVYNAVEDLLKLVASYFENSIVDTMRWHSALLQRMTQPIPGVRPALLAKDTFLLLDALRGFRHFFRHAYVATIEYEQLHANLEKARRVRGHLLADVEAFLQQLQPE